MSCHCRASSTDGLAKLYFSFKEKYLVPDIPEGLSGAKYIFILESPHKDELKHGCPAAGYTGRNMSRKLLGGKFPPLGRMLKDKDASCAEFGIMNVCQIPMQGSAYQPEDSRGKAVPLIAGLEILRLTPERGPQELYEAILKDFSARIKLLPDNSTLLACGNFARHACGQLHIPVAYQLYHPYCWNFACAQESLAACELFPCKAVS